MNVFLPETAPIVDPFGDYAGDGYGGVVGWGGYYHPDYLGMGTLNLSPYATIIRDGGWDDWVGVETISILKGLDGLMYSDYGTYSVQLNADPGHTNYLEDFSPHVAVWDSGKLVYYESMEDDCSGYEGWYAFDIDPYLSYVEVDTCGDWGPNGSGGIWPYDN
jgi:hypothetical protein